MVPNTECSNCNKNIYKSPYSLSHHKIFFCDKVCQKQYQRKNSKRIIVDCNYCGNSLIKNSSQQRSSKTGLYFCNNLCKNKYLAKNKRWQKDEVNSHHQRKNILYEKVNNTCQKCGYDEDKRMLDIHHYDQNHQNNKWDNLRVLCVWCHIKCHRLKENYILPIIITCEEIQKEVNFFHKKRERTKKDKIKILKICLTCGEEYTTLSKKQKYCSNECSEIGRRIIKNRPSKEQLLKEVRETNYCAVGRRYGVSDNCIRKWLIYK